jgi:hypothetical protein
LAKGEKKLYFQQEILGDAMNIIFTIIGFYYLGLLGIGLAMLFNYLVYGIYVFYVVNKKFQFEFRKNTLLLMVKSIFIGLTAGIAVSFLDYPNAYVVLAILSIISLYYSFIELNKRIELKKYLQKVLIKFRK